MKNNKIVWISVLQGFAMLLVVIGHIDLNNSAVDIEHPLANFIHSSIYGFHMPLFMYISGYLYFKTRIRKNKSYCDTVKDKIKRLYIPMLFFTLITFAPKLILAPLMKHPAKVSIQYLIDVFIFFKVNPLGEMWFIVTLLILMTLYPIYRFTCSKKIYEWLFLFILLLILLLNIQCDYFQLSNVCYMAFFFYSGILCSKYEVDRFFTKGILPTFAIFAFILNLILINNYGITVFPVINNIIGIFFSISICKLIAKYLPNVFSSFRDYTYQIFLIGIFFQMCIRYVYINEQNIIPYWILYIISIFVGLYIPVYISKFIKKVNLNFLNICFGL